eukprot:TRINITY_DN4260_c0_g2_i1.p1 TRINITY_DN4260_c0_g2~~TRINITY_DN4260_c0_g2_i1.p1  ORF type:complete len:167 (-),score=16.79 TRINITY_DN4260_c0_g2_i1:25-525(-)
MDNIKGLELEKIPSKSRTSKKRRKKRNPFKNAFGNLYDGSKESTDIKPARPNGSNDHLEKQDTKKRPIKESKCAPKSKSRAIDKSLGEHISSYPAVDDDFAVNLLESSLLRDRIPTFQGKIDLLFKCPKSYGYAELEPVISKLPIKMLTFCNPKAVCVMLLYLFNK